jgi:hypothetical protein
MDRVTELKRLAGRLEDDGAVEAAWLAKSFQDRVVFVEVPAGDPLPEAVRDRLREAGLRGVNDAYGLADDAGFAGDVGDRTQHRFVDVRDRTSQTAPIR